MVSFFVVDGGFVPNEKLLPKPDAHRLLRIFFLHPHTISFTQDFPPSLPFTMPSYSIPSPSVSAILRVLQRIPPSRRIRAKWAVYALLTDGTKTNLTLYESQSRRIIERQRKTGHDDPEYVIEFQGPRIRKVVPGQTLDKARTFRLTWWASFETPFLVCEQDVRSVDL